MARPENVDAVVAAILTVYSNASSKRPAKAEIIAESGVAHKTFYRILNDYPEVQRQLAFADAIFDRRPDVDVEKAVSSPLKANPVAAISELLDTIAKLTEVIESQRKWMRILEQQLGSRPKLVTRGAPAAETDTSRPRRHRSYKVGRS